MHICARPDAASCVVKSTSGLLRNEMSEVALTPYAPTRSRSAAGAGGWLRALKKWLLISLGAVLVLVGLVGAVLPGHLEIGRAHV